MMYQAGLVLEGGAMKGVYTAGVLDFFLDAGIDFAKCYGVSAGACCLCRYLSRQKGRQYSVFTDYLEDKDRRLFQRPDVLSRYPGALKSVRLRGV